MDINLILILLTGLVILSYFYNIVFDKIKIPSVLMLIGTGVALRYLAQITGLEVKVPFEFVNLLGTIGLIMIVLEGCLDLEVTRIKLPLIGKSFLSALLILLATCGLVFYILHQIVEMPLREAAIYSIPFGVISSAIAIPSAKNLSEKKKEFIVYESTFSDILGIMVFNYVILDNALTSDSVADFFINLGLILLISFVSSALLLFLLHSIKSHVKSFLVFSLLICIYSISKYFHLPSLLLILIFGIMLNNNRHYIRGRLAKWLEIDKMASVTSEVKLLTAETAFLVRTFFFMLFGYMMDVQALFDLYTAVVGSMIILGIMLVRYIFLRFISKTHVFPELFIAPRGLITVVLFYSIPAQFNSHLFSEGILYFVIVVSSLIMMFGLMFTHSEFIEGENIVMPVDEGPSTPLSNPESEKED